MSRARYAALSLCFDRRFMLRATPDFRYARRRRHFSRPAMASDGYIQSVTNAAASRFICHAICRCRYASPLISMPLLFAATLRHFDAAFAFIFRRAGVTAFFARHCFAAADTLLYCRRCFISLLIAIIFDAMLRS